MGILVNRFPFVENALNVFIFLDSFVEQKSILIIIMITIIIIIIIIFYINNLFFL